MRNHGILGVAQALMALGAVTRLPCSGAAAEPPPASVAGIPAKPGPEAFDPIIRRAGWSPEDIAAKTISRSGRYLVIAASAPGTPRITDNTDLYLLGIDGSIRALTDDTAGYAFVQFSGDETLIAYASRAGAHTPLNSSDATPDVPWTVFVQSLQTGKRHQVFRQDPVPPGGEAAGIYGWIPTTHLLLYGSARPAGLYLLRSSDAKAELLSPEVPDAIQFRRRYTYRLDRERRSLTVALLPGDPFLLARPTVWQALKTYGPFVFPNLPDSSGIGHDDRIDVSADGKKAVFFSAPPGQPGRQLIALDLPTGNVRLLGTVPSLYTEFVWTNDSTYLLCAKHKPPKGRFAIDIHPVPRQPLANVDWSKPKPADIEPIALILPPR